MKQFNIMLKPASSACNLRCKYCFYADLAGKRDTFCFGSMSEETAELILHNVRKDMEFGDAVSFAFQGGEPTLTGLTWYQHFVRRSSEIMKGMHIRYSLQTNGTKLDDQWAEFLHQNDFLVGLSIDSLSRFHNLYRVDINGKGTYARVMDAVQLLRRYHVEFNILCTLTSEIARHPVQVWNWICENDFSYVQFTPCLDELDGSGGSPYVLHPKKFASFYISIFHLWLKDFQVGRYRSIKLFDDIVNLLAYGIPTACGIHGNCMAQMVIEADGSAYPCDFYCLDAVRMGNLTKDSFESMISSATTQKFISRPKQGMENCRSCPYVKFCGGGCRRMQREVYCVPGGKYCGYREFLDEAMPALQQIALQQRNLRRNMNFY